MSTPSVPKRRLKKSETLEIRLPHPTKLAFMARCREDGHSASETLRAFIDGHLEGRLGGRDAPSPAGRRARRLIAGTVFAAAIGAIALPSLARPSLRADFDRLDLNADHAISVTEFSRLDTDRDGKVSFEEFRVGYQAQPHRQAP